MTLNLSQVTTPADLVEQNNVPVAPNTDRLDALVEGLELNESYELALKLVQRLGSFHQSVVEQLKEEANDLDRLVVWVEDERQLHTCYNLLSDVYNND